MAHLFAKLLISWYRLELGCEKCDMANGIYFMLWAGMFPYRFINE